MKVSTSGLRQDSPAKPLLLSQVSYQGTTDVAGNAFGTTLQDTLCSTAGLQPGYAGLLIKLLSSNAAGQVRPIAVHTLATGIIAVAAPWTDFNGAVYQVPAGTQFVILSATGGGGTPPAPPTPDIGLWFFGVCSPAMAASTTAIEAPGLAGLSEDILNNRFWMQILHNDDAVGTAPEREIRRITNYVSATGVFTTDAFSANVEANDSFCVFHESIMGIEILGYGTLDTSSATVPADSTRTATYAWENDDYFKGCILMPTEGDCRFQPRPILAYTNAIGEFALAEPFTQAPGLVDYVLVSFAYPAAIHVKIDLIFDLVNAIFKMNETGGNITTDGAEQNIYINDDPMGIYEPRVVKIDCTNMGWGDDVILRWYERIVDGGAMVLKDQWLLEDVQDPALGTSPLVNIELEPNRFGVQVTIEQSAGTYRAFPWEVLYNV